MSSILTATFDIEEWTHSENVVSHLHGKSYPEVVRENTGRILDLLAERGARSTFFILGEVAERHPALVRRIASAGHEVASHSYTHRRLYRLDNSTLDVELRRSKATLEQISGQEVVGIRAPTFSISDRVLDAIAAAGYRYDSSYFNFGLHDRYGRVSDSIGEGAAVVPLDSGLLELPVTRLKIGPVGLPWGGGGYYRLLPPRIFRAGVRAHFKRSEWFMFYLHPWEIDTDEPLPDRLPLLARIRHRVGRRRVLPGLARLLDRWGSRTVREVLEAKGLF